MSVSDTPKIPTLSEAMKALHAKWGWIVAFGVIALIAGFIALGSVVMATASAVMIVGRHDADGGRGRDRRRLRRP